MEEVGIPAEELRRELEHIRNLAGGAYRRAGEVRSMLWIIVSFLAAILVVLLLQEMPAQRAQLPQVLPPKQSGTPLSPRPRARPLPGPLVPR